MIQQARIKALNRKEVKKGAYVLYWMQASQRAEYNHALEYAILKANELRQPIIVFFGITDHFPEGNERHYYFMLEGLREVKQSLQGRGIQMVIQHILGGTWSQIGGQVINMNLCSLAPYHYYDNIIPTSVKELVNSTAEGIANGTIQVPFTYTQNPPTTP